MTYEAYRQNKMETGSQYQDFVMDACASYLGLYIQTYSSRLYQHEVGETRQGAEIKHDERFKQTRNLWIEVAEKARPRPGDYAKSGLYRGDNTWLFIIGDYDVIFIFQLNILQLLHASGRYRERENGTLTSVGFLLPEPDAIKFAGRILHPQASQKIAKHVQDMEAIGRELHAELIRDGRQLDLFGGV